MADATRIDRLRAFAIERRVFTRAEVSAQLGQDCANAIPNLVGDVIDRKAYGVYAVRGIKDDDARVVAKKTAAGARDLTADERASDAARAEAIATQRIERSTRRTDSMVDRVAAHFADHPVALATDLRRTLGNGAAAAAKTLADRGELARVNDGLWVRAGVDAYGPEMQSYIAAHSTEMANVRREIEQVAEIGRALGGGSLIAWRVWRPEGRRGIQIYLSIEGMPSIWAQSQKGATAWRTKGGALTPFAAERVARMVLNPIPERFADLLRMAEDGTLPTEIRRRHGEWREYQPSEDQVRPHDRGYNALDTHVLDPRRLGNGLPEEVTLLIDDREDDRLVTILTDVPNLKVMCTRLEMADFVARHGVRTLAIERKTSDDLASSLDDNRLVEQVRRMSESGTPSMFVIEGGVTGTRRQPLARLASLRTRLQFGMGMPVFETIDLQDTAYLIVTAIRDSMFGEGTRFDLAPVKTPGISDLERATTLLQSIPGISTTRAAALIDHFGSIATIAGATAKEISAVDGIGRKTAEALRGVLHAGDADTHQRPRAGSSS